MNHKAIGRILGFLLLMNCVFIAVPFFIACYDGDMPVRNAFLVTIILCAVLGGLLLLICRNAKHAFFNREGFITVSLGWILLSCVGALPFRLSGGIPRYIDALFEVVSGFTTTGASILSDIESMSRGLLYWRSFTHWLGGMGILVLLLAVVSMGKNGYSVYLLRAESPGPSVGKFVPKMRQTADILYLIYIVLTVLCTVFLLAGGMPLFDSLCTAFGTAGTGGFGVKNDSLASYSPYIQNVCTVFMALFGVNFNAYFLLLIRKFKQIAQMEELRVYFGIMFLSVAAITVNILPLYQNQVGSALHDAAFAVSSIMTTTGFSTADFNLWPELSRTLLVILMICGACAGSTGGGIKCARVVLMAKHLFAQFRSILHPGSVNVLRMDDHIVSRETLQGTNTYMIAYSGIVIISVLLVSLNDFSLETTLTSVLACLNNIGPGLGMVGPSGNYAAFSDLSKAILMLDMLLGRLEIFPILMLLFPKTWHKAN